jgi:hypothetical protein
MRSGLELIALLVFARLDVALFRLRRTRVAGALNEKHARFSHDPGSGSEVVITIGRRETNVAAIIATRIGK